MSEYRRDPVTGRWVVIAPQRARRPRKMRLEGDDELATDFCPFCPGNENATPPAIAAYSGDDSGDSDNSDESNDNWRVRVVSNKYPAVATEASERVRRDDPYMRRDGLGAHEVIIESADHVADLSQLSDAHLADVVRAWRERVDDLGGDQRLEYALIFKNQGVRAGATVEHAHSQLMALPAVPDFVADELEGSRDYHAEHDRCVFCDLIERNLDKRDRLVYENDKVVVFAPFASRFPFELWLMPRQHQARFEDADADLDRAVARALGDTLTRLHQSLDDPPYNLVVHTAPLRSGPLDYYHWHIEIIPTLSNIAGFEWGSGWHINSTAPESAADHLKKLEVDRD